MTSEDRWLEWFAQDPLMRAPTINQDWRVVVFSAHPDDEVLAIGGLLSQLDSRQVTFCAATDGENSHPGSRIISPHQMADKRQTELTEALKTLGHDDPQINFMGMPDSGLETCREQLTASVRPYLDDADLVLCPLRCDGHPDHDVLGDVVTELCRGRVPVWEYPVWIWHLTTPGDRDVPWADARYVPIDSAALLHKRRALGCFPTQTEPLSSDLADQPVLPKSVLTHFDRSIEVVFV